MDCVLLICFQRLSWQRNNQRGKNMQVGALCSLLSGLSVLSSCTVGSRISSWLTARIELLLSMCVSVKILDKRHIVKSKKAQYVKRERDLLSNLDHPFFVKLYFTFQDDEKLCILKQRWHAVSCGEWHEKHAVLFLIAQVIKVPVTAFVRLWLQCINHVNYISCVSFP